MIQSTLGPAGPKLFNVLGPDEAERVARRVLRELRLAALTTPDERYRFGERLTADPAPVLRVIGRCIMAQAIMHGAKAPVPAP
jgi:hypothetical protein